jgi:hypothetical protein
MTDEAQQVLSRRAAETVVAAAHPDVPDEVWRGAKRLFVALLSEADVGEEAGRRLGLTQRQVAATARLTNSGWEADWDTQNEQTREWADWLASQLEDQPELATDLAETIRVLRFWLGPAAENWPTARPPEPAPHPAESAPRIKPDPGEHGPKPPSPSVTNPFEDGPEPPPLPQVTDPFEVGRTPPGTSFGDVDDP